LTPITSTISRKLYDVIDRITGDVLGVNGLSLKRTQALVDHRTNAQRFPAVLDEDDLPGYLELMQRLSLVPGMVRKDEKITGCDTEQSSASLDWNLSVISSGSEVRGLSRSHSPWLYD
jgi:hypothetical protein